MNLWQRFVLWASGSLYIGDRTRDAWKEPLPHYIIRCPVHGLVTTYPRGYKQRLECPRCEEASKRRLRSPAA